MLKIRLSRVGRKKRPLYRVVVTEHSKPTSSGYLEVLGHYDSLKKKVFLKEGLIRKYLEQGAKVSNTIAKLLVRHAGDKKLVSDFGIDKFIEGLRKKPKRPKKKKIQEGSEAREATKTDKSEGELSEETTKKESGEEAQASSSDLSESEKESKQPQVGEPKPPTQETPAPKEEKTELEKIDKPEGLDKKE